MKKIHYLFFNKMRDNEGLHWCGAMRKEEGKNDQNIAEETNSVVLPAYGAVAYLFSID